MRVSHDKEMKIVGVWLTKQESENNEIFEQVKKISAEYKKIHKKYKTVIYVSGVGDLVNLTADILKRNKKCSSA